jgi:hypothetical protein
MGETRAKITAKMLRQMEGTHRNEKKPCEICGMHDSVTVLHHVLSLEEAASLINKRWIDIGTPRETVWLCPTCHTYVHWLLKRYLKDSSTLDGVVYALELEAGSMVKNGVTKMVARYFEEKEKLLKGKL